MHAYTVEPLYVQHGQDLIAADFYRPKHQKTCRSHYGAWLCRIASF